jgi:hypothetical protein
MTVEVAYRAIMCRNIIVLRGLEPPVTNEEIQSAALQYVRKVGALSSGPPLTSQAVRDAVEQIASATATLINSLAPRRSPRSMAPPGRRRTVPN